MTTTELNKKYQNGELSSSVGDQELRYLLFSPMFKNLNQNKVVYHERFTSIIKLENIILTPEMFQATAIHHLLIDRGSRRHSPVPERWTVGANWGFMRLLQNCLSVYSGWLMWVDPVFVEQIERLTINENFEEALNLTLRA